MNRRDLDRLITISKLIRDQELSQLARKSSEANHAKSLKNDFVAQGALETDALAQQVAYRKNHEFSRRIWRERELYSLVHHEARTAALAEAQTRTAAKALARAQVVEALRAKFG